MADIEAAEAGLLRQVVSEVQDVLRGGHFDPGSDESADPIRQRLLPDGHRDDPQLAAEYRELTEASLRTDKLADAALLLETVPEGGGRIDLDEDTAQAWLRALNDVRLALGVDLDVQEADDPVRRAEATGDPRWRVYSWLTAIQGLLIDALAPTR